ncbi:hypothetical protein CDO87_19085 [Sagittula sp. P11]|nr:hypothetical protein CDO87_19085 [Sagittula sp. P11]
MNYRFGVEQDAEARIADAAYARVGIDDGYVERLRAGIAGAATDNELDDLVGHRIRMFRDRGHTEAVKRTAEWRRLAMMLCVSEYEALERAVERDEGVTDGETCHPLLTTAAVERKASVGLKALFRDFLANLENLNRADATIRKWQGIYDAFCDYVRHDDAARVTKADVRAWRD